MGIACQDDHRLQWPILATATHAMFFVLDERLLAVGRQVLIQSSTIAAMSHLEQAIRRSDWLLFAVRVSRSRDRLK